MWRSVLRAGSLLAGKCPSRSCLKGSPKRALCSGVKQEGAAVKTAHPIEQTGTPELACSAYKLQGRIPTALDKRFLLWSGRFKTEQDIPEMVSIEMLYAARNKIRVQVCYLMIGLTVVACLVMVVLGKKAFKNHENLTKWNLEKKAKLKEQFVQEQELVAGKAQ